MSNPDPEQQQMKSRNSSDEQLATLYNRRMEPENLKLTWPKFHEKFYPDFTESKLRVKFYEARNLAMQNKLPGVSFTGLPYRMIPLNVRRLDSRAKPAADAAPGPDPDDLDSIDNSEDDDSDSWSRYGGEYVPYNPGGASQEPPKSVTTNSSSSLRRPRRRLVGGLYTLSPDDKPLAKMRRTGPSPLDTAVTDNAKTSTPPPPGQAIVAPLQPLSAASFNSRVRFDRVDRDDWMYIYDLAKNCPEETKRADALAVCEKELLFENDELKGLISALQAEIAELKKTSVPVPQTRVDPELSAAVVKMKGLANEANSSFDELWGKAVKYIPPFHLDSSEFGLQAAHDAIKEKICQIQSSGSGEKPGNGPAEMVASTGQKNEGTDLDFGKSAK
ncbi:hypothetical protein FQN52_006705 [Onygenales sp. PD_12]|nr:hypothetical protein FQN52_006705 [Onygenales sp. PD_12]